MTETKEAQTLAGPLVYFYQAGDKTYQNEVMRNGVSLFEQTLPVRYLQFAHASSRPIGFRWEWQGFLIFYGIFLVVSSVVLLTDNETFPRRSALYFTRKKPFINMIVR